MVNPTLSSALALCLFINLATLPTSCINLSYDPVYPARSISPSLDKAAPARPAPSSPAPSPPSTPPPVYITQEMVDKVQALSNSSGEPSLKHLATILPQIQKGDLSNINQQDAASLNSTPLLAAIYAVNKDKDLGKEVINALLQYADKIDINLTDNYGDTMLHRLCHLSKSKIDFKQCLQTLKDKAILNKIDINRQNNNLETPLHTAISCKNVAIVQWITTEFRNKIDKTLRDTNNRTIQQMANRCKVQAIKDAIATLP